MKRILSFLLLAVLLSLAVPAGAAAPLVIDNAGLLTSDEVRDLEERAQYLSSVQGMDIVILTVPTLGGRSARDYADDFYDQNGYTPSGLLLLLAMEEREWYISTCGEAIRVFTDRGLDRLGDAMVPWFSDGDYYGGFSRFLAECPGYFEAYRTGGAIDSAGPNLLVSLAVGLIAAAVAVGAMAAAMNTRRPKHSAGDYLKQDSFRLRTHRDLFLYSNLRKIRRQQQSGGGSSVHRSSGGRSHGGRGGKF